MSYELEHENDAFLWENQTWANLSNGISNISDGDKAVPEVEPKEEEEEKKRVRGATTTDKGKKVINGENKEGEETIQEHEIHIWTERERRKKMRNMFSNLHSLLPQLPPKADKSTIVDEAVTYIKTLESTLQRLQKHKLDMLQGVGPSNPLPYEPSVAATSKLAMLATRESFMADQVSLMNNNNNNNTNNSSNSNSNSNSNNNNAVNNNARPGTIISASASHLPMVFRTWTSSNVVLNICGNDAQFSIYAPKKQTLFTAICYVFDKYKLEATSAHITSDADRCVYMIQARAANGATDHFPGNINVDELFKQAAGEIMLWVTPNQ
ncbi:Transcription factor bHLH95 [Bienertia sinuspersici]